MRKHSKRLQLDMHKNIGGTMKIKLYHGFAFVALVSAIFALVRIGFGEDSQEVVSLNLAIGVPCVTIMILLMYKERRQNARRD